MFIKFEIYPNMGYSVEQAAESGYKLTVGMLREILAHYDDEAQIVTYDMGQVRGASWGIISEISEVEDDD